MAISKKFSLLILIALLALACLALFYKPASAFLKEKEDTPHPDLFEFHEWMATHKKDYFEESEFKARFGIWRSTKDDISAHNSKEEVSFKKGFNKFSDLTDE